MSAVPVRGVLIGRFRLIDGRPGDTADAIAQMCEDFQPGTVPILSRHGGLWIGTLDTLTPWDAVGCDLAFTGTVSEYPDLIERLRRGVSVSSEQLYPPFVDTTGWPTVDPARRSYFTRKWNGGYQLCGVAISEAPAARGSFMVAV